MDELKEGDEIVAATAEGTLSTDTVSLLSIAKPEASASEYIVLTTAANQTLTLTASHHVPVGEGCCSKVKVAKEIAVGDVVHTCRAPVALRPLPSPPRASTATFLASTRPSW